MTRENKSAPIEYLPAFIENADDSLTKLQTELDWERRSDAPRSEYYCNDFPNSYFYGQGKGKREYKPRPYSETILEIRRALELYTKTKFEACFLNRYLNQSDSLGWHSDNSPEMDDVRPIVTISLGVEREIWFRKIDSPCNVCGVVVSDKLSHKFSCSDLNRDNASEYKVRGVEKIKLGHGSCCIMLPGMQNTWQHRIPKASFQCGERISLTFRGYVMIENSHKL